MHINEVKKEEPESTDKCDDVEVYEADVSLIDEYEEEEEEIESSDLMEEVECSLTQTETKEDCHRTEIL